MSKRDLFLTTAPVFVPLVIGVVLISFAASWALSTIGVGACFLSIYNAVKYYSKLSNDLSGTFSWARPHRRFPWLLDLLAIAVFALITGWALFPCIKGNMPISWDHPVHFLRFWDFVQLLGKGQLSGWSDIWNQGYPLGESYPPGANWWCGIFYVLTLGQLSLEATYALAFLVFYLLLGVSAYHLGKSLFNRPVGFIAGLVALADIGGWRQGGYEYIVNAGVWTQSLGTIFTLFALSYLYRVLVSGRRLDLIFCALAVGASLLCHPMCLVYYGITLPIFFFIFVFGDRKKTFILPTLVALLLGFMLAAVWFIPFFMKSDWFIKDVGVRWLTLEDIAYQILTGTLFKKTWPFLVWLGMLGGILAYRRKHSPGIFLLLAAAVLLVVSAEDVFFKLDYQSFSSSFENLFYERFCVLIKPLLFILAGYAVVSLFELESFQSANWRNLIVLTALMICILAPFAKPVVRSLHEFNKLEGRQIWGNVTTKHDIHYWRDFQNFSKWLKKEKQNSKGFFRVAYEGKKTDHFFALAPVYTGIPAYKKDTSVAPPFQGRLALKKTENHKWLSIKYVVKAGKINRPNLELEHTFGKINVYRNKDYSPKRYSMKGPGKAKFERFESEYIKLTVSGATARSRVVIHRANFENWRAKHNGNPISISKHHLAGKVNGISVPASDGVIEIWYAWPLSNILSSVVSWFALVVLILIGIVPRFKRLHKYAWFKSFAAHFLPLPRQQS